MYAYLRVHAALQCLFLLRETLSGVLLADERARRKATEESFKWLLGVRGCWEKSVAKKKLRKMVLSYRRFRGSCVRMCVFCFHSKGTDWSIDQRHLLLLHQVQNNNNVPVWSFFLSFLMLLKSASLLTICVFSLARSLFAGFFFVYVRFWRWYVSSRGGQRRGQRSSLKFKWYQNIECFVVSLCRGK
jgi:hypothetical protein